MERQELVSSMLNAMSQLGIGRNIGEVRWAFENVILPYYLFHDSRELFEKTEADPLYPFGILEEVAEGCHVTNIYKFTPDMTDVSAPDGNRLLVVQMPEPKVMGHSFAIMIFTDADYDYPGYFLAMLGKQGGVHIIARNYEGKAVAVGAAEGPGDAGRIAYEAYARGREEAVRRDREAASGT